MSSHPFAELIGLQVIQAAGGRAVTSVDATTRLHNPQGAVHGGVLFSMLDTAMGAAVKSLLDPLTCVSIEIHIRYLRPAIEGRLVATAEVVERGNRIVQLRGELRDDRDRLLATASGSFLLLEDPSS